MKRSRVVRLSNGNYGRIVVEKVKSRSRVSETIRGYIDFMYEKLLEWLDEDEVWYGSFDEMLEDAIEYIYDELARAPEHLTPCDNGVLTTTMFADYVFNNRLWSDSDIADDLNGWVFEPEDLLDNMKVVACFEELTNFRDALPKLIKVKVRGVEAVHRVGTDACHTTGC